MADPGRDAFHNPMQQGGFYYHNPGQQQQMYANGGIQQPMHAVASYPDVQQMHRAHPGIQQMAPGRPLTPILPIGHLGMQQGMVGGPPMMQPGHPGVQQPIPGRPLTPMMSTGSPASVPMAQSASPMVMQQYHNNMPNMSVGSPLLGGLPASANRAASPSPRRVLSNPLPGSHLHSMQGAFVRTSAAAPAVSSPAGSPLMIGAGTMNQAPSPLAQAPRRVAPTQPPPVQATVQQGQQAPPPQAAPPTQAAPSATGPPSVPRPVAPPVTTASSTSTSHKSTTSSSGRPSSSTSSSSQQTAPLSLFIKTGVYLSRLLRNEMTKRFQNPEMSGEELAKNAKEVERIYLEMEKLAQAKVIIPDNGQSTKVFIDSAASADSVMNCLNNAVSYFHQEEQYDASALHHYELLRQEMSNYRPMTSFFKKPETPRYNLQETHEQFETAVRHMIRDRDTQKSHNYRLSLHPAGLMCSLLEIELSKRKDPVFVAQVKATVFVQYGQLVIVRLSSPTEKLITEEEAVGDSRFEVFRKMSCFATAKLSGSSTSARLTSTGHISAVIMFLQLFTLCFNTPCYKCKKVMKDLLPPTRIADVNMSKPLFQHETCE